MPRLTVASSLIALAYSSARAQEKPIATRDAPVAVIQNVSARFPEARIAGVSTETVDGKPLYEVTLKQNGRTIDVTATPEGWLTLIEREIARRQLPRAVETLLRAQYPRATFKMVERVTSVAGSAETLSFYEVLLIDKKKQMLEVQVSPDGKAILNVEKKKKRDPD
jgi:hypothetical protein